jgi:hypothetical protein
VILPLGCKENSKNAFSFGDKVGMRVILCYAAKGTRENN